MGGWEPHAPRSALHEMPSPGSPQETAAATSDSPTIASEPTVGSLRSFPLQSQRVNTSGFTGHVVASQSLSLWLCEQSHQQYVNKLT